MERSEFLKRAGVGSVVLASFPALAAPAWASGADDGDDDRTGFIFQVVSGQAAAINAGESIVMSGSGNFRDSQVRGGGHFVHFDGRKIPSPNFIATGEWRARRVLSFTEIGTWGVGVAGIAQMAIELRPCEGQPLDATLKIVCNIGPAGLVNNPFQQEGITLTVPGLTPFAPFTPNLGLTFFTRRCDDENDD